MTTFIQPLAPSYPAGVAGVFDYNSLKQAMQDWNARADIANYVDYFIQRAEQTIYNDIFTQNLSKGVKPMEATLAATISNGVIALPTGYLGLKYALVSFSGNTIQLERRNAEFIYTQYQNRVASGIPQYIARDGQNLIFGPFPDSNYAISGIYWQRTAQLTSSNTTTWMTVSIPTILLAAVNKGVAAFNKDDAALAWWDSDYKEQLNNFLMADRAEEQSGSAMAMVTA